MRIWNLHSLIVLTVILFLGMQTAAQTRDRTTPAEPKGKTAGVQQDSLADVFLLAIGNKWTFSFASLKYAEEIQARTSDGGTAEYTVVGVTSLPSDNRWHMIRRRNFMDTVLSTGNGNVISWVVDSTIFDIVESLRGRHLLQISNVDPYSVFSFPPMSGDSSSFYRYVDSGAQGNGILNIVYPYAPFTVGGGYIETVTYSKDTGVAHAKAKVDYDVGHGMRMEYSLLSFVHPSIGGPYLAYPRSVELTSLVGIPKDTAIVLKNIGPIPMQIMIVRSSDTSLSAFPLSNWIDAYSNGSLALHLTSRAAGVTTANLIITSNSLTSPDTIVVTSNDIFASSVSFGVKSIDIGYLLLSRKRLDTAVVVGTRVIAI